MTRDGYELIGEDDGVKLRVTVVTVATSTPRDHARNRTYSEIELPADDALIEQVGGLGTDCYIAKVQGPLGPNLMLACTRSHDLRDLNAFAKQLEAAPPSAAVVADAQLGLIRRPPTMADAMAAVEAADSAQIEVGAGRAAVSMGKTPPAPASAQLLREEAERRWRRERMGERRREAAGAERARVETLRVAPTPPAQDGPRLER